MAAQTPMQLKMSKLRAARGKPKKGGCAGKKKCMCGCGKKAMCGEGKRLAALAKAAKKAAALAKKTAKVVADNRKAIASGIGVASGIAGALGQDKLGNIGSSVSSILGSGKQKGRGVPKVNDNTATPAVGNETFTSIASSSFTGLVL